MQDLFYKTFIDFNPLEKISKKTWEDSNAIIFWKIQVLHILHIMSDRIEKDLSHYIASRERDLSHYTASRLTNKTA